MAAFDPSAELSHQPDYRLVADSFVTMFWDRGVLERTVKWLSVNGYQIVSVPAGSWRAPSDMHRDIAQALDFPDYYGKNLDALNDCLRDVALGDYGLDRRATGFALVLTEFDRFAAAEPVGAHALLDIFADRSRNAALFGQRMICLVQSDDPQLRFEPVGATHVGWNQAEWLNSDRGQRTDQ